MNIPMRIRPLGPGDRKHVAAAFDRLSPATVNSRFLGPVKARPALFAWLDELDGRSRIAVGAAHAESGEPLGVARFVRDPRDPSRAEIAVTVVDEWQRRGVGTALLAELARRAAAVGVECFTSTLAAQNRAAIALLRTVAEPHFGPVLSGVTSAEVWLPAAPARVVRLRPRRLRPALVAAVSAIAVLMSCAPAFASTIDVSTNADTVSDDGQCSLREAITAAFTHLPSGAKPGECRAGDGNQDTVKLGAGKFVLTRVPAADENDNAFGDLDIRSSLTLQGAGAGSTTIDANKIDRVIQVRTGARATVDGVTITGGKAPNGVDGSGAAGAAGGGILSDGPQTLTVRDSVVTLNRAGNGSAGLQVAKPGAVGGAPGGTAGGNGSDGAAARGVGGGFGGSGGGIASRGALEVERSTISENSAGNGGVGGNGLGGNAGGGGGGVVIGGNGGAGGAGTGGPGGPGGRGGGINGAGPVLLTNSTVTLNAAGTGGTGGKGLPGGGGVGGPADLGGVGGTSGVGGEAVGGAGGSGGVAGGLNADAGAEVRGSTVDHNTSGPGGRGGEARGGPSADAGTPAGHGGAGGAATGGNGGAGGSFAGLNLVGASTVTNSTVTAQAAGPGGPGGDAAGGQGGAGGGAPGGPGGATRAGDGGAGGGSAGITGFDPALNLVHVTVTGNVVGEGGIPGVVTGTLGGAPGGADGVLTLGARGAAGQISGIDGTPRLTNSVVAANIGGNCAGTVVDGGHDLSFGDATCPGLRADPLLGDLTDNGGPTETRALAAGSPAVDIVPSGGAGCTAVDQRGGSRPGGAARDAGGFQSGAAA